MALKFYDVNSTNQ